MQQLRLPPERRTADDCPSRQVRQLVGLWRDEDVAYVLSLQVAGQHCAWRQVGGYILREGGLSARNMQFQAAMPAEGTNSQSTALTAAHALLKRHLHGVHGDVYPALQQGVIDLLREQALATNICERLAGDLVACGLDYADLEGALFSELWECSLHHSVRHS